MKQENFVLIYYKTEDKFRSLSEDSTVNIICRYSNEDFVIIDKYKNLILSENIKYIIKKY